MEVKAGYKKTEVGVIPENWNATQLKKISPVQSVGLVINPSTYVVNDGTVPMLVGSDVSANSINWENARQISEASNKMLPASRLYAGDLVTVRVGEPGITAVIPPELDGCNCASMMIVRQHKTFDSHWLCYVMNSRSGLVQVENVQYGTAQKQFNISDAINFTYATPPLAEQRAIATALSDVDALLAAQDKLIAKKRDIKQAAMQQLLTGKQRLPGFSGEWEVKRLGDILKEIGDGATPSTANRDNFDGSICWVVIDDIKDEIRATKNTLTEKGLRSCAATLWQPGTLILSTGATIGEVGIAHVPVATKQGICGLVFEAQSARTEFMKYWFVLNKSLLLSKAQGSSIKEVRAPTLVQFEVHLPCLDEQTAIATMLSDMDAELTALQQQRDKTRALKQGMMQELLTGRIRLV